ncbi:MAG: ATP-binding protein [Acidobacteriota bacterium]|nr:ATP-binding protein [Acidobacteriota bacterium]
MLEELHLKEVGPAPTLAIELKSRINILAGDNGLGKTFLLDVGWWALTRTWARGLAMPHLPPAEPEIRFRYTQSSTGSYRYSSTFNRETEKWSVQQGRPPIPGLVLYAQVDGGFSVWDPARNYWKKEDPDRPSSYLFSAQEVWEGNRYCEGLIRDWASWQREGGEAFEELQQVLQTLAPSENEPLEPGELRKVFLDDARRYPTLRMPYGQEVAVIHASAGMRRIIALAYLLVWAWQEHLATCQLRGSKPTREIIFLIDEIEAHLHPQWQRRIVPALTEVMNALTGENDAQVQLIAATHSPLVLASIEPQFDPEVDAVFHLNLAEGGVELQEEPWAKQGDVVGWLVSDIFGLRQGRSLEAERAIEAAEAWMREDLSALPPGLSSPEEIHQELERVLAGHDPFWPRWIVWTERHDQQEVNA